MYIFSICVGIALHERLKYTLLTYFVRLQTQFDMVLAILILVKFYMTSIEKHLNIEKHLLPQFVNTIQVICCQNVYKINFYFLKIVNKNTWAQL